MGLILDSSVLVAAERRNLNPRDLLASLSREVPDDDVGISVISLVELAHGASRADVAERRERRLRFIDEISSALAVFPVTASAALLAGRIDGDNQARGKRVALADLLIGATALDIGYGVGTANLRHFHEIPGLRVVQI